jgi:hypothetical protein
MAEALPVEILLGIYLGLLVGVIPALIAWSMGFAFKYFTGVTLPGFGVTILAIALAGVNGGLLAIADQSITQNPNAARLITAIVVVGMISMYAHSKGDAMGATFPRRLSLRGLSERTLSLDLADVLPDRNEVRIRVVGEVADMEGYPPLAEELRGEIRGAEFTFPADLRIGELEARVADRLRTEFDLGDAVVTIDERGRATVVAAPPFSGLSKRVGEGRHAVSVDALLPTGLARGDEVTALTTDAQVRGTVVSAHTGDGPERDGPAPAVEPRTDEAVADDGEALPKPIRAPTTGGGEGRVTLAVTRTDVQPLLRADRATVVVESRGTRREYEVISMLRRADRRFRRLTVEPDTPLDGVEIGEARLRSTYDVAILAVRGTDGWQIAPRGETILSAGTEVIVAGRREALGAFESEVGA